MPTLSFPKCSLLSPRLLMLLAVLPILSAAPVVESLSRGVIAVHQPDGKVFVSWRLLASDPVGTAFNLYRETAPGPAPAAFGQNRPARGEPVIKLNATPMAGPTWLIDASPSLDRQTSYFVRPVLNGVEGEPSRAFVFPHPDLTAALCFRTDPNPGRLHAQRRLGGRSRWRR